MKVAIGSDHAGYLQKTPLISFLKDMGIQAIDMGPSSDERCDYPDYADKVARAVSKGEADFGVLICGTGLGMAITADKVAGVRAVAITNTTFARLAREHNDANVICLSGRYVSMMENCSIVETFLQSNFAGGRHEQRVEKIMREEDPAFSGVSV